MPPAVLLTCVSLTKGFGAHPLFEGLSFGLSEGDRVGLIGPNGSGKSTFLRILAGIEEADTGTRAIRRGTRVGYVPQDPVFPAGADGRGSPHRRPRGRSFRGLREGDAGGRLARPGRVQRSRPAGGRALRRLAQAPGHLPRAGQGAGRPPPRRAHEPPGRRGHPLAGRAAQERASRLCGGEPRPLVPGERRHPHARARPALSRGALPGAGELQRLPGEARRGAAQPGRVPGVARQPGAPRGGVAQARGQGAHHQGQGAHPGGRAAHYRARRDQGAHRPRRAQARVGLDFNASDRKTKKLLVATGLGKSFGGRRIVSGLDVKLTPGTRLGLLGPNGSGKTTLLSLLDGSLEPDAGTIERAEWLRTVRFEQGRETLDRSVSLRRALAPEGDSVLYQGRSVHVASWAKRFLFRSEQLDTPVSRLSGGEQARILIARLMLQPADLLILDEPTNDLDIPTLEVLEESLLEFPGALILVTHDRYLLESVSTVVLALDGKGNSRYFADYAQWEAHRETGPAPKPSAAPKSSAPKEEKPKRLSYKEKLEWEQMEAKILEAEDALAAAQKAFEDPAVATDFAKLQARSADLETARQEVERLYARWAELEGKKG